MTNKQVQKGKQIAIIAYLTFIGTIIAFYMNRETEDLFAKKHIKNMFGLIIFLAVTQIMYPYVNFIVGGVMWWTTFGLWIFSLATAILGKDPNIPWLSEKFQEWFKFLD